MPLTPATSPEVPTYRVIWIPKTAGDSPGMWHRGSTDYEHARGMPGWIPLACQDIEAEDVHLFALARMSFKTANPGYVAPIGWEIDREHDFTGTL